MDVMENDMKLYIQNLLRGQFIRVQNINFFKIKTLPTCSSSHQFFIQIQLILPFLIRDYSDKLFGRKIRKFQ